MLRLDELQLLSRLDGHRPKQSEDRQTDEVASQHRAAAAATTAGVHSLSLDHDDEEKNAIK